MSELETNSEGLRKLLIHAAKLGAVKSGYEMTRIPGQGLSNVWSLKKGGKIQTACIRTSRDRWFAFPPLEKGKKWKTLGDVELVIVATVDARENPKKAEVYMFPASEVRKRFDAAYTARIAAGRVVKDNYGMWINLFADDREIYKFGSGIAEKVEPIIYPIQELLAETAHLAPDNDDEVAEDDTSEKAVPKTIAEVMAWAREQVAAIAGVRVDAVKIDLKVEY